MQHKRHLAILAASAATGLALTLSSGAAEVVLSGSIKNAAGEKMGGVTVSAKAVGSTITTTVFTDDFDTDKGWTRNPSATDTATTGLWERADPAATTSGGTQQVGTTPSGVNDLVTGAAAGASVGANDVDGGTTSIRSPAITIPATGTTTLSFKSYFAHLNNSGTDDFFRVQVVGTTTMGAVIGTGSYSLIDGSTVRTPGVGVFLADEARTNMENNGVKPDVFVENSPEDNLAGRDRQLEVATREVLKSLPPREGVAGRE